MLFCENCGYECNYPEVVTSGEDDNGEFSEYICEMCGEIVRVYSGELYDIYE